MSSSQYAVASFVVFLMGMVAFVAIAIFDVRVFIIPPMGALPDGRTLVISGLPNLNLVDSVDARCVHVKGPDLATGLCRAAVLGTVGQHWKILARLPYVGLLDDVAQGFAQFGVSPIDKPSPVEAKAAPITSECLSMKVERTFEEYGFAKALISLRNGCPKKVKDAFVDCNFKDGDKIFATGLASISSLQTGQTGAGEASGELRGAQFRSVDCRITGVYH